MTIDRLPASAIIVRVLVIVALLALGAGAVGALVATRPSAGRNAEAAPPPRITVLEVAPVEVARFVRAYGTARATARADVPARVAAVVRGLGENFAVGRAVEAGEVLVELDPSDSERAAEAARAAIAAIDAQTALLSVQEQALAETAALAARERELAERDLARAERAASEGAAQEREVDRALSGVIAARRAAVAADDAVASVAPRRQALLAQRAVEESRLALAELAVERCTIRAPIAGVLQLARPKIGESVVVGDTVARIVDLGTVEVPLRIPASMRALAPVGARADAIQRGGKAPFEGIVSRVEPEDDPATRTAAVYIEVSADGAETAISPGAFIEARISDGSTAPRTLVPRRAIRDEHIMTVREGRIELRRVEVDFRHVGRLPESGVDDEDWAVLVEPLERGTLVVIDGARALVEGQRVEPVRAARTLGRAARTLGRASGAAVGGGI